ncbi:hypothetical protein D6D19_09079 [Aureobasidium pullulans]|uniref:Uncharacterized protein n=1 Tax=Aureobasidium pullulans TaxID=5580 RepID=A0A4S8ZP40_AURPU|nr:hypothetical protein D6D19_09079 [Aureobasidium pullulans]
MRSTFIHSTTVLLASVLPITVTGETLLGCAAINCPNLSPDHEETSCQVQEQDHTWVGIETVPNPIDASAGNFTWTLGVQPEPYLHGGHVNIPGVTRSFYLGTPPGTDLANASYTGCALIFDRPDSHGFVPPYGSGDPTQVTSDSCSWGLGMDTGDQCLEDLQAAAFEIAAAATDEQNSTTICTNIADSISGTAPASCSRLQQNDIHPYTVYPVVLTGSNAPKPISSYTNASSNCWPTLPKTNELTPLYSFNYSTNDSFSWFAYSPVMSLFFDTEKSASSSDRLRQSSFHCLKAIDSNDFANAIETNGSGMNGVAGRGSSIGWSASLLTIVTMTVMYLAA